MSQLRFRSSLSVLFLVGVGVGAAACSSSTTASDAGVTDASVSDSALPQTDSSIPQADSSVAPDSAAPDSSVPDSSMPMIACSSADAGAQCNTIVNGATDVPLATVATALPTGTGGTIADGRYYLTGFTAYAGSPLKNVTLRQTLEICGGGKTGQLVNDEAGQTKRKGFTVAPVGIVPNTVQTCQSNPTDADIPYSSYTATATTFTLYSTVYVFSATYTRQ